MKKLISSTLIFSTVTPIISFAENSKYDQLIENVKQHMKNDAEMFLAWNHLKNGGNLVLDKNSEFVSKIPILNKKYNDVITTIFQMVTNKCEAIKKGEELVTDVFFHHLDSVYSTLDSKENTAPNYFKNSFLVQNIKREFSKVTNIKKINANDSKTHVDADRVFENHDFFNLDFEKPKRHGTWKKFINFSEMTIGSSICAGFITSLLTFCVLSLVSVH